MYMRQQNKKSNSTTKQPKEKQVYTRALQQKQIKTNLKNERKKEEIQLNKDNKIRLNKYLSNAGICSRREADKYIKAGLVKVNGKVVTELGVKINPTDEVRFNDQIVKIEKKVYILLNKPKDYITTTSDERGRKTVMQLIKGACKEKVFPVGRLDRNTTGVLLLTNDGELAAKLTHPRYKKKKIYHVYLDKNLKPTDMEKLTAGIDIDGKVLRFDAIAYASQIDRRQVGVEIHSGQYHFVRKMFEALNYKVVKLDRVYFAGLTKKGLQRGKWRF